MAIPGLGYRTAADVLMEVSFHLSQPAVYQGLIAPVAAGAGVTAIIASTTYVYPGAQLVIEVPGNAKQEVVTVLTIPTPTTFTANFANSHTAAAPVWGPTFPTQQGTDPIFAQSEMLTYLSRAQNEFLTAVPCFYERFFQNVNPGGIYQATPPTAILIDRIAASAIDIGIASMVRSGNVVTLTAVSPTNLVKYNTLSIVNAPDPSFNGVFAVNTAPSANVITYSQVGANASTVGGNIQSMRRLYEVTQEELVQQNRSWQSNYSSTLQSWFEDRAGLYKWGVGGLPASTFPVELLCATRDTDTLTFLDGFKLPDPVLHGVKYLTLNYAWSKDGVSSQPQMAEFCLKRYAQVVLATQRYIQAMKIGTKPNA
jgi:hypothetical protein